jgi:hypothetical protein
MQQLVARLHNNSDNREDVFYVVRAMSTVRQRSYKHASLIREYERKSGGIFGDGVLYSVRLDLCIKK